MWLFWDFLRWQTNESSYRFSTSFFFLLPPITAVWSLKAFEQAVGDIIELLVFFFFFSPSNRLHSEDTDHRKARTHQPVYESTDVSAFIPEFVICA